MLRLKENSRFKLNGGSTRSMAFCFLSTEVKFLSTVYYFAILIKDLNMIICSDNPNYEIIIKLV